MLQNLKILDFSSVLAGPAVGTFFAELGAQVIKVENKAGGGDVTRQWKVPGESHETKASAYFSSVNYGKSYHFLDVFDPDDHQCFMELLQGCDLLITNQKPSSLERMNLAYDQLKEKYPELIYGQITGFDSDPDRVAYDVVVQAETGYMFMNGTRETAPVKLPLAFMDLLAAHQLKEGLLVALLERSRTGKGAYVKVSLEGAGIASLANQASNYLMAGHIPQAIGSLHPNIAPYGEIFTTADNLPVVMAVGSDRQFKTLCNILGCAKIAEEPRFETNPQRVKHRIELHQSLSPFFKKFRRDELMKKLISHNVPAGAVKNMKEVFQSKLAQTYVLHEKIDGEDTRRVRSVAFNLTSN
ncbi:MAG: CoA transferase [Cryomorphaceae bacterium]|nr:MAG: CoA transferase [Cryomorphaceae bacterium]